MSLVHNGPASDSLDEGIAFSILFRAAKSLSSQVFPDFRSDFAFRQFYLALQHKIF
jgi:hypothetical protein